MKIPFVSRLSTNLTDSIAYTAGNYLFRLSSAATTVAVNGYLGPTMAGALAYISAIDQNVDLLCQPVRSAIEREVPPLERVESAKAREFAESAFMLSYALMLVGSTFYGVLFVVSGDNLVRSAALFFIAINIARSFSDLLRIYHAAYFAFKKIALALIVTAMIQPVIVIGWTWNVGFEGSLWGRLVVFMITGLLLFLLVERMPRFHWRVDPRVLLRIYSVGFPLVLNAVLMVLIITIDKFFVGEFMGLEKLGCYSVGSMVLQMLLLLPNSVYGSYFPKFIAKSGDQRRRIEALTQVIKVISMFAGAVAFFLIHPFFVLAMPEFIDGEPSAKILIVAFYFAASYQMYYFELIRRNKVTKANILMALVLMVTVGLFWVVSQFQLGIEGIATATLIGYGVLALAMSAIAMVELEIAPSRIVRILASTVVYSLPLVSLLVVDAVIREDVVMRHTIQIALFIPMFAYAVVRTLRNAEVKDAVFNRT